MTDIKSFGMGEPAPNLGGRTLNNSADLKQFLNDQWLNSIFSGSSQENTLLPDLSRLKPAPMPVYEPPANNGIQAVPMPTYESDLCKPLQPDAEGRFNLPCKIDGWVPPVVEDTLEPPATEADPEKQDAFCGPDGALITPDGQLVPGPGGEPITKVCTPEDTIQSPEPETSAAPPLSDPEKEDVYLEPDGTLHHPEGTGRANVPADNTPPTEVTQPPVETDPEKQDLFCGPDGNMRYPDGSVIHGQDGNPMQGCSPKAEDNPEPPVSETPAEPPQAERDAGEPEPPVASEPPVETDPEKQDYFCGPDGNLHYPDGWIIERQDGKPLQECMPKDKIQSEESDQPSAVEPPVVEEPPATNKPPEAKVAPPVVEPPAAKTPAEPPADKSGDCKTEVEVVPGKGKTTVKPGDTLWGIAKEAAKEKPELQGKNPNDIAEAIRRSNNVSDPKKLKPGQEITVNPDEILRLLPEIEAQRKSKPAEQEKPAKKWRPDGYKPPSVAWEAPTLKQKEGNCPPEKAPAAKPRPQSHQGGGNNFGSKIASA